MTTAHKIVALIAVVCLVFSTSAATAFADTPGLSDADISFSVRGYYSQYAFSTTWTRGYLSSIDGSVISTTSYLFTSDYFEVTPGGTFFCMYGSSFTVAPSRYAQFYDSEYRHISGEGWTSSGSQTYCPVPSGATYARLTQGANNPCYIISTPFVVTSQTMPYIFTELQNVTISSDGHISIPYQTNPYTFVLLDFKFFDSVYKFNNMAFNVYCTYTGGYFTGVREADFGDESIHVNTYYFANDDPNDLRELAFGASNSNPARFAGDIVSSVFSGFRMMVPAPGGGSVSTAYDIQVYDFQLDGQDVTTELEVNRTLDQLSSLTDQLAMSTPNSAVILDQVNNVASQMDDDAFRTMNWFGANDGMISTMLVTVLLFAALGYIFFGKIAS